MTYSLQALAAMLQHLLDGTLLRSEVALWADEQTGSGTWEAHVRTDPPGHAALVIALIGDLEMVWEDDPNDPSVPLIPEEEIAQLRDAVLAALHSTPEASADGPGQCPWDEIDSFRSAGEFERFVDWIGRQVVQGEAQEVAEQRLYGGFPEKWYLHLSSRRVWRLVWPDFPFCGTFEPVEDGDGVQAATTAE